MSDRNIVSDKDKMAAWIRKVEDRLGGLETRKVQGALTMESIETGLLKAGADRTAPFALAGADTWQVSIEKLGAGTTDTERQQGVNALVLRDSAGEIQEIFPRPFVQLVVGAGGQSLATGAGAFQSILIPSYSQPFNFSQTYDDSTGALIVPIDGFWRIAAYSNWQAVLDNTVRLVNINISTNGGATYTAHYADVKAAANSADAVTSMAWGMQAYRAGTRFRMSGLHRSATTPITWTPVRFWLEWIRGFFP